jgi:hypothetical protein
LYKKEARQRRSIPVILRLHGPRWHDCRPIQWALPEHAGRWGERFGLSFFRFFC